MLVVGLGFLGITALFGQLLEFEGAHFSFLRPSLVAAVLATAGAIGTFMPGAISGLLLLPVSLGGGLVLGFLLHKFIFAPLHRAQNTSAVSQEELVGTVAAVDSRILEGGYGRIVYAVAGSRVTSTAKAHDGNSIAAGTQVAIVYIEDNTFFVRELELKEEEYD
jgi:membrane protein implicated in regulation of membrane protease activity